MARQNNKTVLWMSLLLAFVFSEIMIRHFLPEIGLALRKDELLGWSNDNFQTFNPKGKPKNKNTKRILFLGDSFLAGSGLEELEQRFPDQLKKVMKPNNEIHTLASGGWGTDQQLLAYLLKGRAWQPDLVVLAFCANNDIANILSNQHGTLPLKSYFVLDEHENLTLYNGIGQPLNLLDFSSAKTQNETKQPGSYAFNLFSHHFKNSFFKKKPAQNNSFQNVDKRYLSFNFSKEKPEELYAQKEPLSWAPQNGVNHVSAYIHEDFETNRYQWRLLKGILKEFKAQVENNHAKLALLLLPVIFNPRDLSSIAGGTFTHQYQTKEGSFTFRADEPKKRLQKITQDLEIIFLDPTEAFIKEVEQNHDVQKIWSSPTDRHFNAKGHQIIADLLADKIRKLVQD
ncbi:MAG: SGNH/GDSL hydrolase family protein [Myxococcota bacterium]|nr:SGNH/GDSL hydrolase family protein [Myxococcota bacterium]